MASEHTVMPFLDRGQKSRSSDFAEHHCILNMVAVFHQREVALLNKNGYILHPSQVCHLSHRIYNFSRSHVTLVPTQMSG